jgi:hypothetical protein
MRDVRNLAGMCAAATGFGSPRYQLMQALAHAIDALAQDLTGDPALFAAKPHGR